MRGGKGPGRGKPDRQAHARLQVALLRHRKRYSQEVVAWSQIIEKSLRRSKNLLGELRCEQEAEWMERFFPQKEGEKEKCELVEYYRYYQTSPILVDSHHFQFMNSYWSKSKTLYYLRIKRVLQIEEDHQQSLERNIEQTGSYQTEQDKRTFYLFRELALPSSLPQDNNSTLQKILSSMQTKHSTVKRRNQNIQANPSTSKPSRTKERVSQSKTNKPTNNHVVSTFSCKPPPRRKNNYKSLSSQTLHSQQRVSKSKKLATTNSCLNIVQHQSNLNYQRREKAGKPQHKKKQSAQPAHHKVKSSEKSQMRGSKSGKKRKETSSNVKAAIDKTKLKIKMQKNMVIKKHLQSRQSYTKSIDSTCGQALRPMRR